MTDEDIFFTHTIVGPAMSVHLGQPAAMPQNMRSGLKAHLRNGGTSLDQVWKDWILVQGAYPYVGLPRRAPGALRRWTERHALLIGALGLLLSVGAVAAVAATFGFPQFNP